MFGDNPIRPPVAGDGAVLNVQSIFATLQGEAVYAGWPAVFVRLGGCNLACAFCDTEFESFRSMPLADILSRVEQLAIYDGNSHYIDCHSRESGNLGKDSRLRGGDKERNKRIRHLVVITGGEPFLQPISKLCEELVKAGFKVQIETNGTLYREIPAEVDIICSPKNNGKGYFPIRPDLLARLTALKFIISARNKDYMDIAELGQGSKLPVYVQPMDEYDVDKNKANLELVTRLAMDNGYRLSLQMHKTAGIE